MALPHDQEALPPFELFYDRYPYAGLSLSAYTSQARAGCSRLDATRLFSGLENTDRPMSPDAAQSLPWLLSIAHHRLVDFYRLSRPSIFVGVHPRSSRKRIKTRKQKSSQRKAIALVRRLLEALPQAETRIAGASFLQPQLSSAEIAALIGKSEAATKKQLTRLLRRLQRAVSPSGAGDPPTRPAGARLYQRLSRHCSRSMLFPPPTTCVQDIRQKPAGASSSRFIMKGRHSMEKINLQQKICVLLLSTGARKWSGNSNNFAVKIVKGAGRVCLAPSRYGG